MASEAKRQSLANKTPVALPNSAPTPPAASIVSLETALSAAIGARIRITTAAPASSTFEGTLFTADPITNLVAINTSAPNPSTTNASPSSSSAAASSSTTTFPTGSYRIVPISQITSFNLISLPTTTTTTSSFTNAQPSIRALDLHALRAREATALRKAKEAASRRGPKGTSKEAQDLFDALSRTHPTAWQGTSMLVNDSVLIDRPYLPENCRPVVSGGVSSGGTAGVERIKKVVRMEREKLDLKNARFGGVPGASAVGVAGANAKAAVKDGVGARKGG